MEWTVEAGRELYQWFGRFSRHIVSGPGLVETISSTSFPTTFPQIGGRELAVVDELEGQRVEWLAP